MKECRVVTAPFFFCLYLFSGPRPLVVDELATLTVFTCHPDPSWDEVKGRLTKIWKRARLGLFRAPKKGTTVGTSVDPAVLFLTAGAAWAASTLPGLFCCAILDLQILTLPFFFFFFWPSGALGRGTCTVHTYIQPGRSRSINNNDPTQDFTIPRSTVPRTACLEKERREVLDRNN